MEECEDVCEEEYEEDGGEGGYLPPFPLPPPPKEPSPLGGFELSPCSQSGIHLFIKDLHHLCHIKESLSKGLLILFHVCRFSFMISGVSTATRG